MTASHGRRSRERRHAAARWQADQLDAVNPLAILDLVGEDHGHDVAAADRLDLLGNERLGRDACAATGGRRQVEHSQDGFGCHAVWTGDAAESRRNLNRYACRVIAGATPQRESDDARLPAATLRHGLTKVGSRLRQVARQQTSSYPVQWQSARASPHAGVEHLTLRRCQQLLVAQLQQHRDGAFELTDAVARQVLRMNAPFHERGRRIGERRSRRREPDPEIEVLAAAQVLVEQADVEQHVATTTTDDVRTVQRWDSSASTVTVPCEGAVSMKRMPRMRRIPKISPLA